MPQTGSESGRVSSRREVARRLGLTHHALQRAERAGRIAREPDGSWDIEKVRRQLAASSLPGTKTARLAEADIKAEVDADEPGADADALLANAQSFHDVRTAHELLKAQERKLKIEERKRRLVDKAKVVQMVQALAKQERDAILAWPSRVAAEMAIELGVDPHRLQTLLQKSLREYLAQRHEVRLDLG